MATQTRKAAVPADDSIGIAEDKTGSLSRALAILDMFSMAEPKLRLEDVGARLGCSQATAYRYLAYLSAAGLISSVGNGIYGIGPRVIELESLALLTDPLLIATKKVMGVHPPLSTNSVYRLCSLYGEKVLCIHRQGPDEILVDGQPLELKRSRGTVMPLFQGAASLAILAFLQPSKIQSLYLNYAGEIARLGLGNDWSTFRSGMSAIRRDGRSVTRGQFIKQLAAVSVPMLRQGQSVATASLTCVLPIQELDDTPEMLDQVTAELKTIATRIGENLP